MTQFLHRSTTALVGSLVAAAFILPTVTLAADMTKTVYRINDTYSLYVLPFTLSHDRYNVVAPAQALRDTTGSTTLTYTMKTPEGLRVKDGRSVASLTRNNVTGESVLYVLYEKSATTSRVNTLAVTALPFALVSNTGTTTTELREHELRPFTLSDDNVKALVDSE
jgi:hypothetical protein